MKLLELFDRPNEVEAKPDNGSGIVDYSSTLEDGSLLEIEFFKSVEYVGKNNWYLSFTRREAGAHSWSRSNSKTGQGGQVEVMSTVVNVASQFVAKYNPDMLQFSAEKPSGDNRKMSRANLYKRMADRLAGHAYDVQMDNDYEGVHFRLVKKGFETRPRNQLSDYTTDDADL